MPVQVPTAGPFPAVKRRGQPVGRRAALRVIVEVEVAEQLLPPRIVLS